jgi:hypothetical protein
MFTGENVITHIALMGELNSIDILVFNLTLLFSQLLKSLEAKSNILSTI